ncbi:hypothetical protein TSMEX_003162 [Taenia solium]|eukprot:TsM_000619400 transcript=TsM_000619400 gene=TsM_000619400
MHPVLSKPPFKLLLVRFFFLQSRPTDFNSTSPILLRRNVQICSYAKGTGRRGCGAFRSRCGKRWLSLCVLLVTILPC